MTDLNLIGKRLDEYHILSQLGEGGMSTIYLGLDTALHRYTAIKVIHAHLKDDPENVNRFKREARAVAALDHPNIVRLYRYGQVDDILYMAMQYIEGIDLRIVLKNYRDSGSLIPIADALRIVQEICQALDYAHQRGVLHRDVKPSNIMLNREGKAILTDFGLALIPDVDTQGTAFGTPQYMAPEQAQSPSEVGPPSDLYALGMVMYEMFTGEVPFHNAGTPMEMVALRATTPPPKPSTIQSEVNPDLEAVILKALALDPADRYQSGAELTEALKKSLPNIEAPLQLDEPAEEEVFSPPERETPSPPVIVDAQIPEEIVTPQTADPPPAFSNVEVIGPKSSNRLSGLSVRTAAAGGCLLLIILSACLIGGIQLIRGQFGDEYQTWMPFTIGGDQEQVSGNESYPSPPDSGSSEETDEDDDKGNEEEDEQENEQDDNEQPDSENGGTLLRIATHGEDSFYLINVGNSAVSLPAFLFDDGNHIFGGAGWGISTLRPGECVSIWKNKGNPRGPNVDCVEIGDRVEMEPSEAFWKEPFEVIFQNTVIFTCPRNGCEFLVPNG